MELTKIDMKKLREEITEIQNEAVKQVGFELSADEMYVSDGEVNLSLDVLLDKFYELISEKIFHVVETQYR